jgi:Na+/phosphate symporter
MEAEIRSEIVRLQKMKDIHHASYLTTLDMNENKIKRINQQIERSTSDVKRIILEKQKEMYQTEIANIDRNIEQITNYVDSTIEAYKNKLEGCMSDTWKARLENNIINLDDAIARSNPEEIFDMFGHVLYALKNINDGFSSIQPCSRETPCSSSLWDRQ